MELEDEIYNKLNALREKMENVIGKFMFYILDENKTVVPVDREEYYKWQLKNDNIIKQTFLKDKTKISTTFLGIDHRYSGEGEPVVFETMIFSKIKDIDNYTKRYTSYQNALAGHNTIVKAITKKYNLEQL